VYFGTGPASIVCIKAAKLRALAITTATRADALPDVPTVGESVPGYEASNWVRRWRAQGEHHRVTLKGSIWKSTPLARFP
jgi:tripartite-type tricarboxylate transporter receptor subunit TctC